jgi:hypothetical protein
VIPLDLVDRLLLWHLFFLEVLADRETLEAPVGLEIPEDLLDLPGRYHLLDPEGRASLEDLPLVSREDPLDRLLRYRL